MRDEIMKNKEKLEMSEGKMRKSIRIYGEAESAESDGSGVS